MNKYQHLFSPIKIGTVEVPNRIALLPMGVFSSRMMNNDGSYTKDGADYYIERAKGGTGLIITGCQKEQDFLVLLMMLKATLKI